VKPKPVAPELSFETIISDVARKITLSSINPSSSTSAKSSHNLPSTGLRGLKLRPRRISAKYTSFSRCNRWKAFGNIPWTAATIDRVRRQGLCPNLSAKYQGQCQSPVPSALIPSSSVPVSAAASASVFSAVSDFFGALPFFFFGAPRQSLRRRFKQQPI
jgi:hypothetical protein